MPESKSGAKKRAKKLGFKQSQVTKSKSGGYYLAPKGVTSKGAKKAYADCRASGGDKTKCAKISNSINTKANKKKK